MTDGALVVRPVTEACWEDVVRLFGERGARDGCWCMRWRLAPAVFEQGKGAANRQRLREAVAAGDCHAVLGYRDEEPVGWCAFGPRAGFPALAVSDALAPVDALPVWSISCFFMHRSARRQALSGALLDAAVAEAARLGAAWIEGYPLDPPQVKIPVAATWTGLLSTFIAAGFVEVARRAPARPVVRREASVGAMSETVEGATARADR